MGKIHSGLGVEPWNIFIGPQSLTCVMVDRSWQMMMLNKGQVPYFLSGYCGVLRGSLLGVNAVPLPTHKAAQAAQAAQAEPSRFPFELPGLGDLQIQC